MKTLTRYNTTRNLFFVFALMFLVNQSQAQTNYYSNTSGTLDQYTSWGLNTDGSGSNPTSFSTAGQIFNIVAPTADLTPISPAGSTTSGLSTITFASAPTGAYVGQLIIGTNIPANTLITGISGNNITISNNATATGSGITFSVPALTIPYTGSTTINTQTITFTSAPSGLVVGQLIMGAGLPNNTTITIIAGATITVSNFAQATGSGVTFTLLPVFTIGANWAVSGTGSQVVIGNGTNPCMFQVPAAYTFSAPTTTVNANSILQNTNTTATSYGTFTVNGTYEHHINGGALPTGTWNTGSTCLVTGITSTVLTNLAQTFYNFTWDCNGQTGSIVFTSLPTQINNQFWLECSENGSTGENIFFNNNTALSATWAGDLIITGGKIFMLEGSTVETITLTVRNFIITDTTMNDVAGSAFPEFYLNNNTGATSSVTFTTTGNIRINTPNSSTKSVFGWTNLETTAPTTVNCGGSFTHLSGTLANPAGTTYENFLYFINSGVHNFYSWDSLGAITLAVYVSSPAILNMQSSLANTPGYGSIAFSLASGAGLMIPNPYGITATTTGGTGGSIQGGTTAAQRVFSAGANYYYTGTTAQVTGSGLPAALTGNLIIDNTSATGVTLSASLTGPVGNLTLTAGQLILSTFNITLASGSTVGGSPFSTSNMVVTNSTGQLIKTYPVGASNFTFPIGDASPVYSPVTLNFATNGTAGTVGARVVNGTNANMNTGGTPADYLTRYFVFTSASIANYAYTLSLAYANGDVQGNSNNLELSNWNGSAWVAYSSTNTSNAIASNGTLSGTALVLNGAQLTGRDGTPSLLYYRSAGVGPADWNTASSWQTDITPAFANPITAVAVPTSANSVSINIQSGNTITAAAAVTASYLYVDGTLQLNTGGSLTGAAQFDAGSFYIHNLNGGTVPTATWNATSTCTIIGTTTTSPTGISGQTFGAFTWDNTSQSIAATLGLASASTTTFNGAFTLQSCGTGTLSFTSGVSATVNLNGDLVIQSGTLNMNNSGAFITTLNLAGNYNQTGGVFQTGAATSTQVLNFNNAGINKNYIQSAGTVSNTGIAYTVNSGAIVTLNNNLAVPTSFTVTGALYCGTNIISGIGTFTLTSAATATLGIGSAAGINNAPASSGNIQVITATFGILANYIYTSTSAQVTGTALTGATSLTFNCPSATLSTNASVTGAVALNGTSGTVVSLGNYSLTAASLTSTSGYSTSNYFATTGTGQLIELVPALGTYTFPVGDNSPAYTPCTFTYTAGTFSGSTYLGARVRNSEEPNVSGSNYLNRYWSLTDNITGGVGNGTFYYNAGSPDVVGNEANIYGVSYGVSNGGGSAAYGLVNTGTHTINASSAALTSGITYDFTGGANLSTLLWFQSVASGNWNSPSTWQSSSTSISGPWTPATVFPNAYNSVNVAGAILIQNGNQVTVTSNVDVANVLLDNNAGNSSITVNSGDTLTVINGTGNDINFSTNTNARLTVNGALVNYSTLNGSTATTTTFNGTYVHQQDGGTVPSATWNTNSNCDITGVVSTVPANLSQNFYNFLWYCTGEGGGSLTFQNNFPTGINGTCEFRSDGTGQLNWDFLTAGGTKTWAGDLIVSGAHILMLTNATSSSVTFNVRDVYINTNYLSTTYVKTNNTGSSSTTLNWYMRNLSITGTNNGGFLDFLGITYDFTNLYLTGNLTMNGGKLYLSQSNGGSAGTEYVYFTGTTQQNINISNISSYAAITSLSSIHPMYFVANSGSILNFQTPLACGTGSLYINFTANAGSTLMIQDPAGITAAVATMTGSVQTPTTRTFATTANYTYNGSVAQITGTALPATVNNLTLNNSAGVSVGATTVTSTMTVDAAATLTGAVTVNGSLAMNGGTLTLSTLNLTLGTGATVTGSFSASNMIVANSTGQMIENYPVGAYNFTFPIGDNTGVYSPVSLNMSANTTAGTVGVRVVNAVNPNMNTGGTPADYLARYFVFTSASIANYAYTLSLAYANGDVTGNSNNLTLSNWNGSAWAAYSSTNTGNKMASNGVLAGSSATLNGAQFTGRDGTPSVLYYRSAGTGPADWNTAASWQTDVTPAFANPITAVAVPTSANSISINIRSGHTITAAAAVTASYLYVDGTLQLNTGGALTGATQFDAGSFYVHNLNGGTVPTATWNATSTCTIIGTTTTSPTGISGQAFGAFTWDNTSQSIAATLGLASASTTTFNGAFTLQSSGTGTLSFTSGVSATVNINGDLVIQSGTLNMNNSGAFITTLNLAGNYNQTGGAFQTGAATSTQALNFNNAGVNKNYIQSAGTVSNTGIAYTVNSGAIVTLNNSLSVPTSFTVTGALYCGTNIISGVGTFTLTSAATATLGIGNAAGINTSGASTGNIQTTTATYGVLANYIYTSASGQSTGTGLTGATKLTFNCPSATLSANTSVTGTVALNGTSGTVVTLGNFSLTVAAITSTSGFSTSNYFASTGTGQLIELVPALGTYTFPVGDNTPAYTPFTFTYTAGTFSGSTYLGARVTNSEEPNVSGSNYLNRYWSLLDNIAGGVGNGTFYYSAGSPDVVGTESNIYGVSYGVTNSGGSAAYGLVNTGTHTVNASGAALTSGTTYDFTGGANISTLLWFQSVASGNWSSPSTWQSSSTSISGPWTPATVSPNAYNIVNVAGSILIQNGNQVTVTSNLVVANVLLDNNVANSSITVNTGVTMTVLAGAGNDINFSTNTNPRLTVNGTLVNYSTINGSTATTTMISGTYVHPQDGGTVPLATWNTNSNCNITGEVASSSGPANLTQNFYNFLWDCPSQTAAVQLDGNIPSGIGGTCEFRRMGTSSQCNLIASDGITRTWAGDLVVSANKIIICVSGANAATTLNVRDVYVNTTYGPNAHIITSNMGSTANFFTLNCRNISINGGALDYDGIFQNNSTINLTGNFTMVGGLMYNSNGLTAGTSALNFSGTTQQNVNISGGAVIKGLSSSVNRTIAITANSGSIVNFQTDLACGTGAAYVTFTAASGSTLMIPDQNGILATAGATTGSVQMPTTGGSTTLNAGANYIYTGSVAQVTGAGLPAALTGKLTIDNTSSTGVTLSASLTGPVGNLTLTAGQLILGSNSLTLAAASTISGAPFSTSNMVVANGTGKLIKTYPVGATNFTFPIGDATPVYSPVTLNFLANGTQGTVGISVANGTPPGTLPADYLTRYFIVSAATIANYAYTVSFNYANADVHGVSTNLLLQQWNGTSWTAFTSTSTGNAMTLTGNLSAIGAPLTTATCYFGGLDGTAQIARLYYESAGVGPADWNTAASWMTANNPSFTGAITAAAVPTSANSMSIWIRPGHTITAAAAIASGSFLTVDGTLQENTGASITTVFPIAFTSTGTYVHNLNGGVIPTAAWNATSLCDVIGVTSTAPTAGLAQAYGNLTWNCPSQTVAVVMAYPTGPTTIQGNVTINNTNTSTLALASAASTVNIAGYLSIQGGTLYLNSTTTSTTLNVTGNLTIGGGTLNLDNANAAQTLNLGGNYNQSAGTFTQTGTTVSAVNFTGTGATYTQSGGTVTNTYINYAINTTGASLTLANDLNVAASRSFTVTIGALTIPNGLYINGSGSFVMANANTATLFVGDQNGINSSGATGNIQSTTRTFNTGANYTYNGSTSQITGTGLVGANNLTFANTSGSATGVTLSGSVTVNSTLALNSGLVTLAAYNLTLPATGSLSGTPSASNMLVTNGAGQFIRGIGVIPSSTSFLFPVGDATPNYTPVTLTFTSSNSAGTVGVNTTNSPESNLNTPSAPAEYLSRYWTLSNSGLTSYNYTGTFTYPSANLNGSQSSLRLSQWGGSAWNEYTGSSSASDVLTESTALTQVTGALSGDFTGRTQIAVYNVTGGTNCGSTTVGISNSQIGVNYQLVLNGTTNVGSPVAGTGSSFNFSPAQTASGTYTVVGSYNGISTTMSGSAVVNTNPGAVSINPTSAIYVVGDGGVSLTASASGSPTFSWSPSAGLNTTAGATVLASPTSTTTYTATATLGSCTTSNTVVVTYSSCATNTWLGGTTGHLTDWFTAANWSCGTVPAAYNNVLIPVSTYYPFITSGAPQVAYTQNLTINSGASLTIDVLNVELDVAGNVANSGTASLGNGKLVIVNPSGAQTITGVNTVGNLVINNSNGVTIASGNSNALNVSGTLALQSGTLYTNGNLTITSNASGTGEIDNFSGSNSGTISGNLTVQRYAVNPTPSHVTGISYYFIGTPVGGSTISQWNGEFTNTAINAANDGSYVIPTASCSDVNLASNSPYAGLFDYNETVVTTCNQSGWQTRFSGTIANGQGFAGQVSNGTTLALTGSFNTGNISTPALTVTATNLTETPGFGWNLISNPYAAPIVWSEVASANSHISGTAYTYITSGSLAGTYNPNNNISEGQIASSEAFWVEATTNGTTVNFTKSMETDGANAFLRTAPAWAQMLSMNVSGNGYNDLLRVAFGPDFTNGYDRGYDAHKLMGNSIQPNLFVTDSVAKYCIYAIPTVTQNERDIPVAFTAGTSGLFSFSVDLNGFDPTALVFLEDLQTHTLQNLMVNSTYSFTANEGDDPARFVLHFVPAAVITSTNADCKGNDGAIQVDLGKYNVDNTTITWDSYFLKDNSGNIIALGTKVNGELTINNIPGGTYELQLTYGSYVAAGQVIVAGVTPVSVVFTTGSNQVSPGDMVQFTNTTSGASIYDWSFGDGSTSSLQNPTHSYADAGTYNVVLTAGNNDCSGAYDQTITVESTTGINDPSAESVAITSYANQVNILFHSFTTLDEVTLNIYDLTGRKIISTQQLSTGDTRHVINLNDIVSGYYFVVLTGKDYETAGKVFLTRDN